MKILLAVIIDLYLFVKELLSLKNRGSSQKLPTSTLAIIPITTKKITAVARDESKDVIKEQEILDCTNNIGYIRVDLSRVFIRPIWAVDTVIATLSLGKKIQIRHYQGRFVNIITGDSEGWILKEEMTTDKQSIWPDLMNGEIYDANNPVTISIRRLIDDEFFTSELYLPLQATEYVTYRLLERNLNLTWPKTRPRKVGLWHEILKGQPSIISSLDAKTGSIMEGITEDNSPFLAYIEAVLVDGSLKITSVGRLCNGQYLRETLSKTQVFNLRPIYIQRT